VIENVPTRAATPDADTLTYPVSYAQASLLDGVRESAVNVPAVARVGARVTPAEVQRVLDVLVARHDALRTVFDRTDGGAIVGRVRPTGTVPLRVAEHRQRPADLLPRVLLAGSEEPFALAGAPLARAELHAAGAAGGLVVLWLHHAVSDLVSVQVLGAELARLLRGGTLDDPGLPMAEVATAERAVRATARQQD
jgi:Condensation domain